MRVRLVPGVVREHDGQAVGGPDPQRRAAQQKWMMRMDEVRLERLDALHEHSGHDQRYGKLAIVEVLQCRQAHDVHLVRRRSFELRRDDQHAVAHRPQLFCERFHGPRHAADVGRERVGRHQDAHA